MVTEIIENDDGSATLTFREWSDLNLPVDKIVEGMETTLELLADTQKAVEAQLEFVRAMKHLLDAGHAIEEKNSEGIYVYKAA